MGSLMIETTNEMLDRWTSLIHSGNEEIDVEREIINTAGEIIAKTSFGMSYENGKKVLEKLRAMQQTLFNSNRYVGVPFSKFMYPKQYLEAKRLGNEIDVLLLSIINERIKAKGNGGGDQKNLLGLMLADNCVDGRLVNSLTTRELVDECKTFFFGGHETTALTLSWTLLLLAMHPEWQNQLREEIRQVVGDEVVDATKLAGLKKVNSLIQSLLVPKHMLYSFSLYTYSLTNFLSCTIASYKSSITCRQFSKPLSYIFAFFLNVSHPHVCY